MEKAKKKKDAIYTIHQYKEVISSSKKKKPIIVEMKKSNFFDIAEGSNFSKLSTPVDASRNKFSWLKIHEFRYEKDLFGFKFRYNLMEEYRTCVFRKKNTRLQHPRFLMYAYFTSKWPQTKSGQSCIQSPLQNMVTHIWKCYSQFKTIMSPPTTRKWYFGNCHFSLCAPTLYK